MASYRIRITYNPLITTIEGVNDGVYANTLVSDNRDAGEIIVESGALKAAGIADGDTMFTLAFSNRSVKGETAINLQVISMKDTAGGDIAARTAGGRIIVGSESENLIFP